MCRYRLKFFCAKLDGRQIFGGKIGRATNFWGKNRTGDKKRTSHSYFWPVLISAPCIKKRGHLLKNVIHAHTLKLFYVSTPMTVLGPLKRDRLTCSCSSCTERKIEKQKVGTDKSERLRILQEQQKYSDPIRGATDAFIHRIRELKSYDLDTAKQEQR